MKKIFRNEIDAVEGEIIEWAKLLATCTPGNNTRLDTRIQSIDHLIQTRKGLIRLGKQS